MHVGIIWCRPDWIIGFWYKTAEIHFLGISCSTFSLFTFHLENSTLSAHVKPSLENNYSNLPISIGAVIKITVYTFSIKFNFMKALFSVCILLYCSLPTTNWPRSGNQVVCYHQMSYGSSRCLQKITYPIWSIKKVNHNLLLNCFINSNEWFIQFTKVNTTNLIIVSINHDE